MSGRLRFDWWSVLIVCPLSTFTPLCYCCATPLLQAAECVFAAIGALLSDGPSSSSHSPSPASPTPLRAVLAHTLLTYATRRDRAGDGDHLADGSGAEEVGLVKGQASLEAVASLLPDEEGSDRVTGDMPSPAVVCILEALCLPAEGSGECALLQLTKDALVGAGDAAQSSSRYIATALLACVIHAVVK